MARWLIVFVAMILSYGLAHGQNLDVWGEEGTASSVSLLRVEGPRSASQIFSKYGMQIWPDIQVFVLRNAERMVDRAEKDQGRRPPEWAAGLAYPRRRAIYLHAALAPSELMETFQHELAHIALARADPRGVIPRWFNEGLAVWFSEGPAPDRVRILTEAASVDGLHHLMDLERHFPKNGARAGVAYAQSVHFVGFLIQRHGTEKLSECLRLARTTKLDFEGILQRVYGAGLSDLETEWRKEIEPKWAWLPALLNETMLWVFAALLLVLGWFRRVRQRKRRLKELREEEAQLDRAIQAAAMAGLDGDLFETDSKGQTLH